MFNHVYINPLIANINERNKNYYYYLVNNIEKINHKKLKNKIETTAYIAYILSHMFCSYFWFDKNNKYILIPQNQNQFFYFFSTLNTALLVNVKYSILDQKIFLTIDNPLNKEINIYLQKCFQEMYELFNKNMLNIVFLVQYNHTRIYNIKNIGILYGIERLMSSKNYTSLQIENFLQNSNQISPYVSLIQQNMQKIIFNIAILEHITQKTLKIIQNNNKLLFFADGVHYNIINNTIKIYPKKINTQIDFNIFNLNNIEIKIDEKYNKQHQDIIKFQVL